MSDAKDVEIVMPDGSIDKVKLVTYLLSDDGLRQYMVYTKSDFYGVEDDRVIYISKMNNEANVMNLSEITDDTEWAEVQKLLRRIANSQ